MFGRRSVLRCTVLQHISGQDVIPQGLSITGELTASQDVAITGRFDGQLTLPEHHLSIEPTASVKAKIVARVVTISGNLEGTVTASERVEIGPGASVTAHLLTPSLVLQDGGRFTGTVDPERTVAAMQVARYRQKNE